MGLWEEFIADGPLPRQALSSAWGSDETMVRDALADLDGPGWQIDRVRFEQRLRAAAVRRGALLLSPAALTGLARTAEGWTVRFEAEAEPSAMTARIVIDAAGRRSQALVPHGARRRVDDRLSCAFIRAEAVSLPAGVIHIEAEAEGWWYAAPVPGGAGILSFHTDADLLRGDYGADNGGSPGTGPGSADAGRTGCPAQLGVADSGATVPPTGHG